MVSLIVRMLRRRDLIIIVTYNLSGAITGHVVTGNAIGAGVGAGFRYNPADV